jgi:hypothetical protein
MAGIEKLNELRQGGSTSNIRRSEGNPNPLPNRSNSRSISLGKDCQTSGRLVCAGGAFFTSMLHQPLFPPGLKQNNAIRGIFPTLIYRNQLDLGNQASGGRGQAATRLSP